MDIQYLNEFIVLADTCMFQEAADILHISQSALSKHIQKIEDELHVTLFDRTTRNVSLCSGGKIFYNYAKRMIDIYNECNYALNDVRTHDKRKLIIGFPSSLGQYRIAAIVAKFMYCYPDIPVEIINERGGKLTDYFINKKIHFIFSDSQINVNDSITNRLHVTDPLCFLLPYDHPLANAPCLSFDQLYNEKFVIQSSMAPESRAIYSGCRQAGYEPQIIARMSYRSNIVEVVRCGLGIAMIGRKYAQNFNMNGLNLVDANPQIYRNVYLQYHKKIAPGSNEAHFLQYYVSERSDFMER